MVLVSAFISESTTEEEKVVFGPNRGLKVAMLWLGGEHRQVAP